MKIIRSIAFLSVILLATACKKNKPSIIDNSDLIGSYEWSWSLDTGNNIIESSQTDNYGILIEQEGYIYTFKNGDRLEKYKFDDYYSKWGKQGLKSYKNLRTKDFDQQLTFLFDMNELQVAYFPYRNGYSNYFYKIE